MSVMPSMGSGLGLTLLATLGAGALAQQAQRLERPTQKNALRSVEPATKSVVRPTQFEWSELVRVQESLPPRAMHFEQPQQLNTSGDSAGMQQAQDLELPMPNLQPKEHVMPAGGNQGDIERLAPCASFPSIPAGSLSTVSQGDGPDGFATFFTPGHAAGSVGPNHLMTMAPNITTIQDRLGAAISSVDTLTFWSPLSPPAVSYARLQYDGASGRWLASAIGVAGTASTIMFAISDTDDPTGGWDFYSTAADPGATTTPDGLNMGYNSVWVAITCDMYSAGPATAGSRLYTFDMAGALAGGPSTINTFSAGYTTATTGLFTALVNFRNIPTRDLDGSSSDIWIINHRATSGANVASQFMRITGTGAAPTVVPTPGSGFGANLSIGFIPVNYSNGRQAVFQVGDIRVIDPLQPDGAFASTRHRVTDAVMRNGNIYYVHHAGLPGPQTATATQNGVCFYEVDPSVSPFFNVVTAVGPYVQDVQISDGVNTTCMYPSIAVNCANDVLIGFSRGDATKDLDAAYCMRLGSDPLNTMGPITLLKAGESSYWRTPPSLGGNALWGHFSTTSVDPNDDKTMWTLQPYAGTRVGGADADSRWGTWWGRLGDCEIRPVITDHPDGLDSCIGNPVNFSVSATTGSNVLTYQWRLNGIDILGANSSTYSIGSAIASDEGVYDCVICGCGQEISAPAVLEFEEPTITTQPDHYTAALGDVAAFFVVATPSVGSLSYQWFHDGNPVGTNDDILAVGPVVGQDYGPYHVVVQDGCGTIQSITVNLLPPVLGLHKSPVVSIEPYVQPQAQIGCVGSSVTFSVIDVPDGSTYEWRKDGVPIAPAETGSSLTLSGLANGDAGVYDCVVDDGNEIRVSDAGVLAMADDPVITDQPDDVTTSGSNTVMFSVTATGQGPLSYQWRFRPNGQGASFTDIVGEIGPTLIRVDVSNASGGSYRCVVTNQCGSTSSGIARLTVL